MPYCGYNESMSVVNLWSVGIDICEAVDTMENVIVENCTANYNYQSGFHMESYPTKNNILIRNCTAIGNGIVDTVTIGSGFTCVGEGVTLANCYAADNKLREYNIAGDANRIQATSGTIINCYENGKIINWNTELAKEVYAGTNLILNGDFKFGTLFYDYLFRSYTVMPYHVPSFMRKLNSNLTICNVYEEYTTDLDNGKISKRFIHGGFVTNLFELDSTKTYMLTIALDSSANAALAAVGVVLTRYNYTSATNVTLNTVVTTVSIGTFAYNETEITEHSIQVLSVRSAVLLNDKLCIPLVRAKAVPVPICNRVYGISLTEVGINDTITPTTTEWVTATAYAVGAYVTYLSEIYYCAVAHTSGTFSTDLAAGDWTLYTQSEIAAFTTELHNLKDKLRTAGIIVS
jgi:hypothetical protein